MRRPLLLAFITLSLAACVQPQGGAGYAPYQNMVSSPAQLGGASGAGGAGGGAGAGGGSGAGSM